MEIELLDCWRTYTYHTCLSSFSRITTGIVQWRGIVCNGKYDWSCGQNRWHYTEDSTGEVRLCMYWGWPCSTFGLFYHNTWLCQQRVEYEGLHLICFDCGKYGHRSDNCPAVELKKGEPMKKQNHLKGRIAVEEGESVFGPWMLPKFERKRVQKLRFSQ